MQMHEYYMVQNDIWRVYRAGDGMLCIGCLEKRMGRKLPVNEIDPETK